MLELEEIRRRNNEKFLNAFGLNLKIVSLKERYPWLGEVSYSSLQLTCRDLFMAYKKFFNKKAKHPKFKAKKAEKQSFPTRKDRLRFLDSKFVKISKIGKIYYKTDYQFTNLTKIVNSRISFKNKKWILSFETKCENQARELTNCSMGIDLGIKELAVVEFDGQCKVYHNINKSKKIKKLNKKLKYYQRKVSRQYRSNSKNKREKGCKWEKSKNIVKTENKIRKIYVKIANIRHNYIHQTTHELVEMLPKQIIMENLKISNMIKNRYLSKAISEMCWHEFIRQMKYKCEWNGIEFIQADRFYPSSKTCSCCGNIKKDLRLSDRTYICDICGLTIDRDYNAAINLSKYVVQ